MLPNIVLQLQHLNKRWVVKVAQSDCWTWVSGDWRTLDVTFGVTPLYETESEPGKNMAELWLLITKLKIWGDGRGRSGEGVLVCLCSTGILVGKKNVLWEYKHQGPDPGPLKVMHKLLQTLCLHVGPDRFFHPLCWAWAWSEFLQLSHPACPNRSLTLMHLER